MKKAYILGVVLFLGIMGGVIVWKSQPAAKNPQEGTSSMTKQYTQQPEMTINPDKTYTATIVTTKGTMVIPLFAKETPVAVNNFVFLARDGFYTNTVFHRIMKGFMIQGGDPEGNGTGGPGYSFADEPVTREYTRGTLAMANSGPDTNGSQFFIMHKDYRLPKQYVIFGAIGASDSASFTVLDALADVTVTDNGMGERSQPVTPPVVQSVSIKEE